MASKLTGPPVYLGRYCLGGDSCWKLNSIHPSISKKGCRNDGLGRPSDLILLSPHAWICHTRLRQEGGSHKQVTGDRFLPHTKIPFMGSSCNNREQILPFSLLQGLYPDPSMTSKLWAKLLPGNERELENRKYRGFIFFSWKYLSSNFVSPR